MVNSVKYIQCPVGVSRINVLLEYRGSVGKDNGQPVVPGAKAKLGPCAAAARNGEARAG